MLLCARMRRAQSPWREVSPVPSSYSEPVSLPRHKDVLHGLPSVGEVDREDAEEVLSLRSLPCVRSTQNKDLHKVKRSRGFTSRQLAKDVSNVRLPAISHQQQQKQQQQESRSMLIVRGLRCGRRMDQCPPLMSSRRAQGSCQEPSLPERPPGRAGRRPDRQVVSFPSCKPSLGYHHPLPRRTDHALNTASEMADTPELSFRQSSENPLGSSVSPHRQFLVTANHASHGVTNLGKTSTHAVPSREEWRQGVAFKRGGGVECVPHPHFLEPLSGFQEQLRRQLLHSPLPYRGDVMPGGHQDMVPPAAQHYVGCPRDKAQTVPQGLVTILLQDAVDVPGRHGKALPKITMTRPTPSPKHSSLCGESRQLA